MPLQEVPDQIAIGWFERKRRGGRLGMQMSRSYIHLNAQAPESLPQVLAVVPPLRAVVCVFAGVPAVGGRGRATSAGGGLNVHNASIDATGDFLHGACLPCLPGFSGR
jgi:hypothetical protein